MDRNLFSALLGGVSAFALSLGSVNAGGLPSGGHYISGQGSIHKANQSVTVKQSSTTGIVDWNKFSIGSKSSVTFDNGSGATLNRVTGGNLSRIAGSLHATGSLYLLNNAGAIVSGTGRVVTGGSFVVSSGSLTDSAFSADDRRLFHAKAAVINRGSITSGGNATLTGGSVRNSGTIAAASVSLRAARGGIVGGGTIEATGNADEGGHILLISTSGKTKITGALVARNANGSGGAIETSGQKLSIAGRIDAGKGGSWLVDPKNLTVGSSAAATIDASLGGGTDVTLKTTKTSTSGPGTQSSGPGDIIIDSALTWGSKAKLTLDAYHSVLIDASVKVTGKGKVALLTDDGGTGGQYAFGKGDALTYAKCGGCALTINGASYTLIFTMTEMQAINADLTTNYALVKSLNASSTKGWIALGTNGTGTPQNRGEGFTGIFEGLGNTISKLTVNGGGASYQGVFGVSYGTIRDIGISGGSVTGGTFSGGLTAFNGGLVLNAYATDAVITNIATSYDVGGLIGANYGTVVNVHATGAVSGFLNIGGLVGLNRSSPITDAYATGAVVGVGGVGGLVGFNQYGSIDDAYAKGKVTSSGQGTGGLVGENAGTIANTYATGEVVMAVQFVDRFGGLVGENDADGQIADSYATGTIHKTPYSDDIGGLVGYDAAVAGSITDCYWDTTTSNIKDATMGDGNIASDPGITAKTTSQLSAKLLTGFGKTIWAIDPMINGGRPYLIALKSSY